MTGHVDISVIIATHRRAASLDDTLRSLAASSVARDRFEVVVADNADDAATHNVCTRWSGEFHVQYLVETTPGKNAALNAALARAAGELYVFTDDDVIAERDWLEALWHAALRWPDHVLFGGRVLPQWPGPVPEHLRDERYLGPCFSVLDRSTADGPDARFLPFGPNMAVRRAVFEQGHRFDTAVGPRVGSYIMGSETSFTRRLIQDGCAPVYVRDAIVLHKIRPDQLSSAWLRRRAFRYGRMLGFRQREDAATGSRVTAAWRLGRQLVRRGASAAAASVRRDPADRFHGVMAAATTLGQLYEVARRRPVARQTPLSPSTMTTGAGGQR